MGSQTPMIPGNVSEERLRFLAAEHAWKVAKKKTSSISAILCLQAPMIVIPVLESKI